MVVVLYEKQESVKIFTDHKPQQVKINISDGLYDLFLILQRNINIYSIYRGGLV
jgi:hypothetical protein